MRLSRPFAVFAAGFVAVGLAGCASAPRQRPVKGGAVDTGMNSTQAARKYLEGTWSLVSFDIYPPGRDPIQLKGSGTLMYDAFGNLRMEIRADQSAADLLDKAGIASRNGVISTDGRVVVDMAGQTLTYVLEGQPATGTPSGPLAANRPRYWQVEGNMLTLTTKDDQGKPLSVGRWRKAS